MPPPLPPTIPQSRCSSGSAEQGFNALLNEMATGPAVCTPLLPEITPGTLIRLQEFSAAPSLAGARPTLRLPCGHEKQAHYFSLLSLLSCTSSMCCHKTPSALSGAPLFIYLFTLLLMSPIFLNVAAAKIVDSDVNIESLFLGQSGKKSGVRDSATYDD